MKKIQLIAIAAVILWNSAEANDREGRKEARLERREIKDFEKEAKTMAKEKEKEGYVSAVTKSNYLQYLEAYKRSNNMLVIDVTRSHVGKCWDNAFSAAEHDIQESMVLATQAVIKGKLRKLAVTSTETEEELNMIVSAVRTTLEGYSIMPEYKIQMAKKLKNGHVESYVIAGFNAENLQNQLKEKLNKAIGIASITDQLIDSDFAPELDMKSVSSPAELEEDLKEIDKQILEILKSKKN